MSLLVAPLALLWPAGVALAVLSGRRRTARTLALVVLSVTVALLVVLCARVAADGPVDVVAGGWPADVGIRLRADALGTSFAVVSVLVVLLSVAHGVARGDHGRMFPALCTFMALGLTGLFLTGDVFSFYVFFELAMISAYALAASGGEARATGAAFIFAVVNLLGSFLFLIAIAALYRVTGTLEMAEVAQRAAEVRPSTAVLIAITFFVAFAVKLGLFPFHFWLPAVYVSAAPAVAAILAGALANIGAYGLLRFGAGLLPRELELGAAALVALGSLSIVYGALQAIGRQDVREVLAYSAIGHAGYVLVALGLSGGIGLAAAVVFTLVNALNKALLFLAAGLRGPLVAACFAAGAFSVAGMPPFAGFFGKAALLDAGVSAGSEVAVGLLFGGGALTFVYLFLTFQREHWRDRGPAAGGPAGVVAVVALLVLAVGLWPEPLIALGDQASAELQELGR